MIILKNKTYNQLLKTIEILITDKKKLSDKCDRIQIELNESNDDKKYLIKENKEQDVFISSLNERVQKAEASYEKLKELFGKSISENAKLMSEKLELESKLSRKGLGVKGKKKENCAFHYDYNTEILKKA